MKFKLDKKYRFIVGSCVYDSIVTESKGKYAKYVDETSQEIIFEVLDSFDVCVCMVRFFRNEGKVEDYL